MASEEGLSRVDVVTSKTTEVFGRIRPGVAGQADEGDVVVAEDDGSQ